MAAGPALSRQVPPDAIGALRPKLRDRSLDPMAAARLHTPRSPRGDRDTARSQLSLFDTQTGRYVRFYSFDSDPSRTSPPGLL